MDKTRNKKRSKRKSRKIKGGINGAILKKDDKKLSKTDWPTITTLDHLNGYNVSYNNVNYDISLNDESIMTWDNIKDESYTIFKVASGDMKRKKWLIGDAISQIYDMPPESFSDYISHGADQTKNGLLGVIRYTTKINSSTIFKIDFQLDRVKIYYTEFVMPQTFEVNAVMMMKTYFKTFEPPTIEEYKQKILDYYFQTINQTSNISEPGRIVKRAVTKLITGESMDSQLLKAKAKRRPFLAEIQEAFGTNEGREYHKDTGGLTFKAELLKDGKGGYVVTNISELGKPGGRAETKLIIGESQVSQLLDKKTELTPTLEEIKNTFATIGEGAYNTDKGELTFNAELLTDGEGGYMVNNITVA